MKTLENIAFGAAVIYLAKLGHAVVTHWADIIAYYK